MEEKTLKTCLLPHSRRRLTERRCGIPAWEPNVAGTMPEPLPNPPPPPPSSLFLPFPSLIHTAFQPLEVFFFFPVQVVMASVVVGRW